MPVAPRLYPRHRVDEAALAAEAARLFGLLQPRRNVAVDISADHSQDALRALRHAHPAIEFVRVAQDFPARFSLRQAGRRDASHWTGARGRFAVFVAQA